MSNPTLTHGAAPESLVAGGPWTAAQSVSLERLAAALPTIDAHKKMWSSTFPTSNISTRSAIRQKTEGPMSAIAPRLPPKCTHCKAVQTTPEWSENAGESEVLYFWHCTACGHEFETRGCTVDRQLSKDELAEEFLPNLIVE